MISTLFITHHYLCGNSGGCYASSAFINAFYEASGRFKLLYPMKKGATPTYIHKDIDAIPVWYVKSKMSKFFDLICGRVHRYNDIENLIGSESYDFVIFDTSVVSFHLIDYFHQKGSTVICIHHNYQYEYFRDNLKGILLWPTLFWCRRYEGEAVRKSDLNLTLTNQDIKLLKKYYGKGKEKFGKLGVFEYCNKAPNSWREKEKFLTFVITGSLNDAQTNKSLIPWLVEYYPLLKDAYPKHRLLIAGRNPSRELYQITNSDQQIEIIPNPINMDYILEQGDVYICPTSLGGGLKLRIMDGLSHGMPIITHTVSARGYDSFAQKEYLLSYDDIRSFQICLEKVKQLVLDKKELINFYQNECSFKTGVKRIIQILEDNKRLL